MTPTTRRRLQTICRRTNSLSASVEIVWWHADKALGDCDHRPRARMLASARRAARLAAEVLALCEGLEER